jgi:Flp pilus assembly protein TadB
MTLEHPPQVDDAGLRESIPFWVAAAGGILLAVASIRSLPSVVSLIGAVLFVLGVVLFFVVAVERSRREGVALTSALGQGARDALRFAWLLMP